MGRDPHMQTWDAIRARRNVRSYQNEPVHRRPGPDRGSGLASAVGVQSPALGLRDRHRSRSAPRAIGRLARRGAHRGAAAAIALVVPGPTTTAPASSTTTTSGRRPTPSRWPPPTWASAPLMPRSATRTRPARSSVSPLTTTSPSSSAWATPQIARCNPSPPPTGARLPKSSTTATGNPRAGAAHLPRD